MILDQVHTDLLAEAFGQRPDPDAGGRFGDGDGGSGGGSWPNGTSKDGGVDGKPWHYTKPEAVAMGKDLASNALRGGGTHQTSPPSQIEAKTIFNAAKTHLESKGYVNSGQNLWSKEDKRVHLKYGNELHPSGKKMWVVTAEKFASGLVNEQHREVLYHGLYPDGSMPLMPPKVFAKSYDEVISERKEREWPYVRMSALQEAINSSLCDTTLDNKSKANQVRDSVLQFLNDSEARRTVAVRGDS